MYQPYIEALWKYYAVLNVSFVAETWQGSDHQQLDPSHILIRRHLVRLHNLLRSKVDPPAANMLALVSYGFPGNDVSLIES